MADTYGALKLPVQLPDGTDAVSDPALSRLGEYFQAFCNANGQAAFDRLGVPRVRGLAPPVIRSIFTHDPTKLVFNEAHLPALYVTRSNGGKPEWIAEDYRIATDVWTVLWVFPPGQQANQRIRESFTNAIGKMTDMAIEMVRSPAWAWADDPDTKSASLVAAPATIKTAIASSASHVSYTGAALNGAIGATVFAPGRHPTITVSGTVAHVLAGSIVTVTGLGDDGAARTSSIVLSAAAGTYRGDWLLTRIDSIAVPGQVGTGASFTFGLDAFAGRGTSILNATGLQDIEVTSWTDKMVAIRMSGSLPTKTYDAIEIKLSTEERWTQDTSPLDDMSPANGDPGIDATITYSDGTGALQRMTLPVP